MLGVNLRFVVFVPLRDIELPLHDNGMEPVEFLKSMGISLTPLNEAAGQKVLQSPHVPTSCLTDSK